MQHLLLHPVSLHVDLVFSQTTFIVVIFQQCRTRDTWFWLCWFSAGCHWRCLITSWALTLHWPGKQKCITECSYNEKVSSLKHNSSVWLLFGVPVCPPLFMLHHISTHTPWIAWKCRDNIPKVNGSFFRKSSVVLRIYFKMMLLISLKSKCYVLAYTNYIIYTFFFIPRLKPTSTVMQLVLRYNIQRLFTWCTSRYF